MTNDQMKANRFLRWQKARKRVAWIKARLTEGRDVYLCTAYRQTRFTAKHLKNFDLYFKATRSGAYVARGKKWDCFDFTEVVAR